MTPLSVLIRPPGCHRCLIRDKAHWYLRSDAPAPWPRRRTRGHDPTWQTNSELQWRSRGIDGQNGSGFLQAVKERLEELPHRLQSITEEQRSHLLPKRAF